MPFKSSKSSNNVQETPYDLFKSLSGRSYPDLMIHQEEVLSSYQASGLNSSDVALQLPTGSGKTLVGLLIAEWRRRKFQEKVIYLCPTSQLVHQTNQQAHEHYKLSTIGFTGRKKDYDSSELSRYSLARNVAVTNYSSFFNTRSAFEKPDIIIIDDAHAAENYIAKMWSIEISAIEEKHETIFVQIANVIRPHIRHLDYQRLIGKWEGLSDIGVVEKLPTPIFFEIAEQIAQVFEASVEETNQVFAWRTLRNNLSSCHFYYSSRGFLIRPMIPPTWTLRDFKLAKQRIFMSATLGEGGDLERLTGRKKITKIATPDNFLRQGVGRRFFIFPEMQATADEADKLRLKLIDKTKRSVVITPDRKSRDRIAKGIEDAGIASTFNAKQIESGKSDFLNAPKACAALANRYDGIDFPNDEARLLCVDSLPRATNLQEMFFMTRLDATVLLNERIQTRITQAVGRCTRALSDYSAVYVTGRELQNALTEPSKQKFLTPEMQAEIKFGITQSLESKPKEIIELFELFLKHGEEWQNANNEIVDDTKNLAQERFPALEALERSAPLEIEYQKAAWAGNWKLAHQATKEILANLRGGSALQGYCGLWHYLSGSSAFLAYATENDESFEKIARDQFSQAIKVGNSLSWLSRLSHLDLLSEEEFEDADHDVEFQIDAIGKNLLNLGNLHDANFAKLEGKILEGLSNKSSFEKSHEELGKILGFNAGKVESSGSPDPWWMSESYCFVFEDHAGANSSSVLSVKKARQASSHPAWIKEHVEEYDGQDIIPVLVTPVSKVDEGGISHLKHVALWELESFRVWAKNCFSVLRQLRTELGGEADLLWRGKAKKLLEQNIMTSKTLERFFLSHSAYEELNPVFLKPKKSKD